VNISIHCREQTSIGGSPAWYLGEGLTISHPKIYKPNKCNTQLRTPTDSFERRKQGELDLDVDGKIILK